MHTAVKVVQNQLGGKCRLISEISKDEYLVRYCPDSKTSDNITEMECPSIGGITYYVVKDGISRLATEDEVSSGLKNIEVRKRVSFAFKKMLMQYKETLKVIWPCRALLDGVSSKHPTMRFSESNMVSSFLYSYKHAKRDVIWQEFPFKEEKSVHSGHIDGLIIDRINKGVIYLEAKMMNKESKLEIDSAKNSIVADFTRVYEDVVSGRGDLEKLIIDSKCKDFHKYILLLVDSFADKDWNRKFIETWKTDNRIASKISNYSGCFLLDKGMLKCPISTEFSEEYYMGYLLYAL